MTFKQVKSTLRMDTLSVRAGVFTARREFYYQHGKTTEHLIKEIKAALPDVVIVDSGEVWKPFRGGATTANSSHWFVKFTI